MNYIPPELECLLCDLLLLRCVVVRYVDVEVFMLEKLDH